MSRHGSCEKNVIVGVAGTKKKKKMWASCNVVGSQQPGGSCAVMLRLGLPVGHAWGRDVAV